MYGSVTSEAGNGHGRGHMVHSGARALKLEQRGLLFFSLRETLRRCACSLSLSLAVRINRAQECVSVRQDSRVLVRVEFT